MNNNTVKKALRQGGWIKSEIYMSDDFNDSFEPVSEKEMRVLEAVRAETFEPKLERVAV